MRGRLIVAACAAGLLIAPAAEAATWRGKTKQGRTVTVRTGADGLVSHVMFRYNAGCTDGKGFRHRIEFAPPLDASATNAFQDGGVVTWRFTKTRERARGRVSIEGGLRSSGRWTGNFRLRVKIRRGGRVVATCRSGRVGWKASPV
jgi:choline dehydrogenase-like flavoprotein